MNPRSCADTIFVVLGCCGTMVAYSLPLIIAPIVQGLPMAPNCTVAQRLAETGPGLVDDAMYALALGLGLGGSAYASHVLSPAPFLTVRVPECVSRALQDTHGE